jgi:hypothetical protein
MTKVFKNLFVETFLLINPYKQYNKKIFRLLSIALNCRLRGDTANYKTKTKRRTTPVLPASE